MQVFMFCMLILFVSLQHKLIQMKMLQVPQGGVQMKAEPGLKSTNTTSVSGLFDLLRTYAGTSNDQVQHLKTLWQQWNDGRSVINWSVVHADWYFSLHLFQCAYHLQSLKGEWQAQWSCKSTASSTLSVLWASASTRCSRTRGNSSNNKNSCAMRPGIVIWHTLYCCN